MKKKHRIVMICIIIFLIAACTAIGYGETVGEEMSGIQSSENYYIDCAESSFFKNAQGSFFAMLNNLIFSVIKSMGNATTAVLGFALSADLFEIVSDIISPLFGSIHKYIFNGFSIVIISLAGFYFILQLAIGRITRVISGIGGLLAIIVLAAAFFTYPMDILSAVNTAAVDLSGKVLDVPYESTGIDYETSNTQEKAETIIWNTLVHQPWQVMEFGSVQIAEKYEDEILSLKCGTDERSEYIQKLYEEQGLFDPSGAHQLEQLSMGILMLIFSVMVGIIMLLACVLIIGYQFFSILLALIGTFIFLLALLPRFGLKLIQNWFIKILSALAVRIVLVFGIAVICVLMGYIYGLTAVYGVLPMMFLMLAIVMTVVIKRKELLGLISGYDSPSGAVNRMMNADGNIVRFGVNSFNDIRNRRHRQEMSDYAQQRRDKQQQIDNERLDNLRMRNELLKKKTEAQNTNTYDSDNYERYAYADEPQLRKEQQTEIRYSQGSRERQGATEKTLYTAAQREKGIEILRQSYEQSKERSEAEAARTGGSVRYTDFVKRTDHVRAMNPEAEFDSRDVEKAARIVHRTEAAGGDVRDIPIGNLSEERRNETQNAHLRFAERGEVPEQAEGRAAQESAAKQKESSDSKRGLKQSAPAGPEYFRRYYGEEKGERFYNEMLERYGSTVRSFSADEKLSPAQIRKKLSADAGETAVKRERAKETQQ